MASAGHEPRSVHAVKASVDGIADEIARIDAMEARLERQHAIEVQEDRKRATRRKIVLGAMVLRAVERDPDLLERIRAVIADARPRDWMLFQDTVLSDTPPGTAGRYGAVSELNAKSPDAGDAGSGETPEGELDDGFPAPGDAERFDARFRDLEAVTAAIRSALEKPLDGDGSASPAS